MRQFKIGVAGSSNRVPKKLLKKAEALGKEIARHNCIIVTGATVSVPLAAVHGAKSARGIAIGISPAKDKKEHVERYKYPTEEFDKIIYTAKGKLLRNYEFVKACDCLIVVCGSIGTLTELSMALHMGKKVGILEGTGGIANEARHIIKACKKYGRGLNSKVYYAKDERRLLEKILSG